MVFVDWPNPVIASRKICRCYWLVPREGKDTIALLVAFLALIAALPWCTKEGGYSFIVEMEGVRIVSALAVAA